MRPEFDPTSLSLQNRRERVLRSARKESQGCGEGLVQRRREHEVRFHWGALEWGGDRILSRNLVEKTWKSIRGWGGGQGGWPLPPQKSGCPIPNTNFRELPELAQAFRREVTAASAGDPLGGSL